MNVVRAILRRKPRPDLINLSDLHIASPCPADWEKMVGDERVRHCADCNLNVYNLSAMTERQVQELIEDSRGKRLCTRLYRRVDGTVLTQDCPWSLRALNRKVSRLAAAVLTAIMGVTVAMARNKLRPATCECSQSQQKDSGIKLVVVDQHGAVIPKAEIHLQNKLGEEMISAVTGSTGEWRESAIAAGKYQIIVKSPGFRTFTGMIEISDGTLLGLKVKLPVAEVNTTVEVKAEPVVIMGTMAGILTEVHQSLSPPAAGAGGPRSPMRP
jgi:hypothetical protein